MSMALWPRTSVTMATDLLVLEPECAEDSLLWEHGTEWLQRAKVG